jgi:raffinose/stachyose/melibiose transport system substrate-binding protein
MHPLSSKAERQARKRSHRITGTAVALLLGATGITATSTAEASAAAGAGTVSVLWQTGSSSEWIQHAIPIFEKEYPDIKVTLTTMAYANLVAQASQILTSSNAPDVSYFQTTMPGAAAMNKAGALVDVDNVWKNSGLQAAVPQSASALWSYNGKHFGIISDTLWTPVIYFNDALFKKAGIALPGTRITGSQWTTIISKLKSAGIQPLAVGGNDFPAYHLISALFQSNASTAQYQAALVNTTPGSTAPVDYSSGPMLKALETVLAWSKEGVFAKGVATLTQATAESLFAAGGAAMISDGSWLPGQVIADAPHLQFGWFLYPPGIHPFKLQLAQNDGVAIPTKAHNKAGAELFLEFLASKPGQEILNQGTGLISPRDDLPPSTNSSLPAQTKQVLSQEATLGTVSFWLPDTTVQTAVQTGFAEVVTGEETPQQVANGIQKVALAARQNTQ